MRLFNSETGFTLLEIMVAIVVFALVIAATGGTFISVQQAWRIQRATINLVQNSRWAVEFIANEIRQGGDVDVNPPGPLPSGRVVRFRPFPGPPTAFVWYWWGNGGFTGNTDTIYRGTGAIFGGPFGANANRQELANFIVNNPDLVNNTTGFPPPDGIADPNFILNSGLLSIELTLRPIPTAPVGQGNRDYTLSTQVRPRN